MNNIFDTPGIDPAWCPGCGNFAILNIVKLALTELKIDPKNIAIASGIGQAAKLPQYLKTNFFNGLHGRALPVATGIKVANPNLTVIAVGGDGDMYGEGGNHLMHTIRRNPNITNFVHNNMVYGLTKGQASPTSQEGFKTPLQPEGVFEEPLNPIALAISLDASFAARIFCGNIEHSKNIIKEAIMHKGYALVDILQPCVSFNKTNTYKWFEENTYYIDPSHNPLDKNAAFALASQSGKMGLGIYYKNPARPVFEEKLSAYAADKTPLFFRGSDRTAALNALMNKYI